MTKDQKEYFIKPERNKNMYPLDINMIFGKKHMCFLTKAVLDVNWYGIKDFLI